MHIYIYIYIYLFIYLIYITYNGDISKYAASDHKPTVAQPACNCVPC